jgi:putative aldouronate transport system substrate-binding protein
MPETTDEFYNLLKAFKTKDPNNHRADEIPLSRSAKAWNAKPWDSIMNAFIHNDGSRWIRVRIRKMELAANTPQWRDGPRYMKKLFDEGLVPLGRAGAPSRAAPASSGHLGPGARDDSSVLLRAAE